MVRRRTASPSPSAPVRSAPRPSPTQYSAPPPRPNVAAPAAAPHPHPTPMQAPPMSAPSQGPGLMGQMAATAGGVAIGSAVGHAVGSMFTGSSGSSHSAEQVSATAAPVAAQQSSTYAQPCEFEWRQFVECAQNQSDISLCNGFNDIFKQCKSKYA